VSLGPKPIGSRGRPTTDRRLFSAPYEDAALHRSWDACAAKASSLNQDSVSCKDSHLQKLDRLRQASSRRSWWKQTASYIFGRASAKPLFDP
jgi:hypothetical protein